MAKLIRINPNESRDMLHDVPGVGVSARRKHPPQATMLSQSTQEFYAVRLLKHPVDEDQTEYYVELNQYEATAVLEDLATFLGRQIR